MACRQYPFVEKQDANIRRAELVATALAMSAPLDRDVGTNALSLAG